MKWYYWLGTIIFIVLGIWTLIPAPASKPCLLGYYAHCSFTPISTLICFAIAGFIYFFGKKKRK
jgi:polyferredoxin